ncbi:hypothetical protein B0H16DRAFT_1747068 [Mycena metata]|uniref:DUF6532 domain-containing protein n=1 Tax=Mycena metata TaxID=1033252 RepID=A0AAD7GV11_9AGAR|nr:hypothetical protein B0H16DRAFT_1747068 [Mycena metata]
MSAPIQTAAEKRKATIAAKAAKELEDNVAFQNESKGGRKAKQRANKKAVWKDDLLPITRKRTSSTQSAGPAKKARATAGESSDEEDEEEPAPKPKTKARRAHLAPPIDIDTDSESELAAAPAPKKPATTVRLDLTKLPGKTKAKKTKTASAAQPAKSVAAKPAKIIADSASEDSSTESSLSESEKASDNEGPIDDETFLAAVPRVITKPKELDSDEEAIQAMAKHPEFFFDSDEDVTPGLARKGKGKSKAVQPTSDSEDSMSDAPPRIRRNSDIEMAEAIADSLVSIPLAPRGRSSSTASGWSSGRDLSVPASEMETDSEHASEPVHPKKKKGKKPSAARQKQADSEKPELHPDPAASASGAAAVSSPLETSWDVTAQLTLPAPNKDIGLTAQNPELQFVLRGAIGAIKISLLFEESYPTMISRGGFARPFLITAARVRQGSRYILARLLTDPDFGTTLAPIPLDRVNILRGDFKRCAVNCIMAFFGLVDMTPAEVMAAVENLVRDHRYIFPKDPTSGNLQLNMPFRHGAIRFVLKEELFSSAAFVTQNIARFPATITSKPDERELPDAMVALAATAVYGALLELRMTGQRQTIAFTEDAYEDTYRNHMTTLASTRARAPVSMHKLMHGLFNEVSASHKTAHTTSGSSATLIQLFDIPDADN